MEIQATGTVIGQPAYGHVGYVAAARQNAMADAVTSAGSWVLLAGVVLALNADWMRRKRKGAGRWPMRIVWLGLALAFTGLMVDTWVFLDRVAHGADVWVP